MKCLPIYNCNQDNPTISCPLQDKNGNPIFTDLQ